MNNTVALEGHAEPMENRLISPVSHDRVAAAAAAHEALAAGVPLLIVAGGSPLTRAGLARALLVDRLAAGDDVLAMRGDSDPYAGVLAHLALPDAAAYLAQRDAALSKAALAEAIATYVTAAARLVVLVEQAELLADSDLAGVRRLRQADPAAEALSVVLLGDDTAGLVADRLLRPSPPGGLRFIRLTPLALAPVGDLATFPPAAEREAAEQNTAQQETAQQETAPQETAHLEAVQQEPAVAPAALPRYDDPQPAPPAPLAGDVDTPYHEERPPTGYDDAAPATPSAYPKAPAQSYYNDVAPEPEPHAAPPPAGHHDRLHGQMFDSHVENAAVDVTPAADYRDAFAQLAAKDAATDAPRTAANPLRRSEIIPPVAADPERALTPDAAADRPRIILPLFGIAVVGAVVGWFTVRALLGIQTPMHLAQRIVLSNPPPQTAIVIPPPASSGDAAGQAAAPAAPAEGPAASPSPMAAPEPETAPAPARAAAADRETAATHPTTQQTAPPPPAAPASGAASAPQGMADSTGAPAVSAPTAAAPVAKPAPAPPAATQQAMVQPLPLPAPPQMLNPTPPSAPPTVAVPAMSVPAIAPSPPAGPGLLVIAKADDTLYSLYSRVYRGLPAPAFEAVAAMNPHDIKLGDVVVFPAPPGGWKRLPNTAGR